MIEKKIAHLVSRFACNTWVTVSTSSNPSLSGVKNGVKKSTTNSSSKQKLILHHQSVK